MKIGMRALMLAVAVVALLVAAWTLGERRGRAIHAGRRYAMQEQALRSYVKLLEAELTRLTAPLESIVPRFDYETDEDHRKKVERWNRLRRIELETVADLPKLKRDLAKARMEADTFRSLRTKYERAAARPWLVAAP